MSNAAIIKDLGHDLQQRIGEILTTKLELANKVLPRHEVIILFVEAAVSTTISAAAALAASVGDEAKAGELFDYAVAQFGKLAALERERALEKVHAARRQPA